MRQLHIRHFFKKNNCESTITIKLLQLQKRAVIEEMSLEEISADRNRDLSSGHFSSTVTRATLSLVAQCSHLASEAPCNTSRECYIAQPSLIHRRTPLMFSRTLTNFSVPLVFLGYIVSGEVDHQIASD